MDDGTDAGGQAPQDAGSGIALETVVRFVEIAVDALADAREEIDALNVYPVPDGDTGTNMYLTIAAARDAIRDAIGDGSGSRHAALAAFSRGALLGARGNSGVILSEMLGALVRRIGAAAADEPNAQVLTDALHQATDASYAAVGEPVEGTMLTVLRAASDAALERAKESGVRSSDIVTTAAAAAREALARTPEQLPVLARAGVVDAGGRGICVILDAAETVLTGRRPVPVTSPLGQHAIPVPQLGDGAGDLGPDGPAFEVMYLLDTGDGEVPHLRGRLAELGDSVVVVGGEGLWNVHVHTDDPGAAVEAGVAVGRPHRIRITHFAQPVAAQAGAASSPAQRDGRRVVAVAAGPGLSALFAEAGAEVVEGGPGRRPSTGEVLDAIVRCGAREVVVLPNDHDSVRTARMAATTAEADHPGVRVAVIPTEAQVQGLAAIAVHEPGRAFDADVTEMTATARHARHGAITVAAREAMTMAGPCREGDALGVISGDFAVVGDDLGKVAVEVVARLLAPGGELVTLVRGADPASREHADRVIAWVEEHQPHVDAVVYDGGQERYPLLMSVE
ncbi:DAK2 domain-containing protein [Nocardioides panacisoli]|uniref:DAK2 domain-containing protein n=1 Tax=Nocardioides panacisoli TaxID=627624 RepID=A0ABP7HX53_9ACTN